MFQSKTPRINDEGFPKTEFSKQIIEDAKTDESIRSLIEKNQSREQITYEIEFKDFDKQIKNITLPQPLVDMLARIVHMDTLKKEIQAEVAKYL